jgi:hypothetical protein
MGPVPCSIHHPQDSIPPTGPMAGTEPHRQPGQTTQGDKDFRVKNPAWPPPGLWHQASWCEGGTLFFVSIGPVDDHTTWTGTNLPPLLRAGVEAGWLTPRPDIASETGRHVYALPTSERDTAATTATNATMEAP